MTATVDKFQPGSLVKSPNGQPPQLSPERKPRRLGRWFASEPAWPLIAMLGLWPLWWLLGFGEYSPVLFAIPMARRMYLWRASGSRKLRVPPGFAIWALFLVISVLSLMTISQTAPDTLASPVSNRLISWGLRTISYVAATVILLYVGNLTEKELPRRLMAWLLGLVGVYTIIGGLLGTFLPNVVLTSPTSYFVPASIQTNNPEIGLMLHPSLSEVQNFLGYAEGRPTAPFTYTNFWGNALAILLPWILVAWITFAKTRRQRRIGITFVVLSVIPIIYSLNRGLWIGLGASILYLAVRFAARGRIGMLGALLGTLALAGLIVFVTPLQGVISQRLAHGASNQGRAAGSMLAVDDGLASPILGWGDTRHQQGSSASIAVGKTASCTSCGGQSVGGNGQVQLLLVTSGVLGAVLYIGFFLYGAWRYRRDRSPYGLAGELVILVSFIFMWVYDAVGPTLVFTMIAYALLWRNERDSREEAHAVAERPTEGPARLTPGNRRAITSGTGV